MTCPRSHRIQWQAFSRLVLHWTPFLTMLSKGKLEKRGTRRSKGCTSMLQKAVSCKVARESNALKSAHREINSRVPVQEPRPGQQPSVVPLRERRLKIPPSPISVFPFPVLLPSFPCLHLCFPSAAPLAPGLAPRGGYVNLQLRSCHLSAQERSMTPMRKKETSQLGPSGPS